MRRRLRPLKRQPSRSAPLLISHYSSSKVQYSIQVLHHHYECCFAQIFHDIAYRARNRDDLLMGIEEFTNAVTVLPPGEWDPSIRIEPPETLPSQVRELLSSSSASSFLSLSLSLSCSLLFRAMRRDAR